jgi:hypothetical protein
VMVRPSHDLSPSWLGRFHSSYITTKQTAEVKSTTLSDLFVCCLFDYCAHIVSASRFLKSHPRGGGTPKNCLASAAQWGRANFLQNSSTRNFFLGSLVWSRLTDHTCVMAAQLSPVMQEGDIWRVRIAWPNRAVHYFGKFTSEQDAIDWINAHPRLTKPENTIDEPQHPDRS